MQMFAEACHFGCLGESNTVWGKFIVLRLFTLGPPRQKPHLQSGVSPCEEKSTARLQCKKELKINLKVRHRL